MPVSFIEGKEGTIGDSHISASYSQNGGVPARWEETRSADSGDESAPQDCPVTVGRRRRGRSVRGAIIRQCSCVGGWGVAKGELSESNNDRTSAEFKNQNWLKNN
jgi:hypothetical protein